ncbi:hypothetical protein GCM10027085_56730 [Spirosoma aerophilum]
MIFNDDVARRNGIGQVLEGNSIFDDYLLERFDAFQMSKRQDELKAGRQELICQLKITLTPYFAV